MARTPHDVTSIPVSVNKNEYGDAFSFRPRLTVSCSGIPPGIAPARSPSGKSKPRDENEGIGTTKRGAFTTTLCSKITKLGRKEEGQRHLHEHSLEERVDEDHPAGAHDNRLQK